MYKQNVEKIKLVIIPLDGVLFNLNKLRYNYCKNFAASKNVEVSKLDFYKGISNMYDMYSNLPFSSMIDPQSFAAQTESDLKAYFEHNTLETKPGAQALFEGLKNRNIKIAVISTHKEQDARFYLKKSGLIKYCDVILGSDSGITPLPSNNMLKAIQNKFGVMGDEVLVVSSFSALNKAAESLASNIIYVKDLVNPTSYDVATSYKTVNDLYDVLNIILFDQYDDTSLYASVLGFNAKMNRAQLTDRYNHLLVTYAGDAEILDILESTYKAYCARLQDGIVYVDQPTSRGYINETTRNEITQEIQRNLIQAQEEVRNSLDEQSLQDTIAELNKSQVQQPIEPVQPIVEAVVEPAIEPVETTVEPVNDVTKKTISDLDLANLKSLLGNKGEENKVEEYSTNNTESTVDEAIKKENARVDNAINKIRNSLEATIAMDLDDLNVQPAFVEEPIENKGSASKTIALEDTLPLVNVEEKVDYTMDDLTEEIEDIKVALKSDRKRHRNEDPDEVVHVHKHKHKHKSHKSSYGFVDWVIDTVFILLIVFLVCTLVTIIFNFVISKTSFSNPVINTMLHGLYTYINVTNKYLGAVFGAFIQDEIIVSMLSVYTCTSLIVILLNTLIKLLTSSRN